MICCLVPCWQLDSFPCWHAYVGNENKEQRQTRFRHNFTKTLHYIPNISPNHIPHFLKGNVLTARRKSRKHQCFCLKSLTSGGPLHTTSSDPGTGSSRNPLPDNMVGPISWDRKHVGLTRGLHGRHNTNKTTFPPTVQKTLCTHRTIFPTQEYNNIQLIYTMHKAHTVINPRDIIHI